VEDVLEEAKPDSQIYRITLDTVPFAVVLLGTDLRIRMVNKGFYDLFGSRGDVRGIRIGGVISNDPLRKEAEEVMKEGGKRELEIYLKPDHKVLRVLMTKINDPSFEGVLITMENLFERIRFEEQLLHAEKLFAMGQLAASITHEIGNPLGIMKSTMNFLHDHLMKKGDGAVTYAQVVMENIDRMHGLLKDLSEFSRPRNEHLAFHDIGRFLSQTIRFVEKECERQGIAIEASIERDLPMVYCNPHRIKQVFLNLVKNAIEAMPEGGTLSISAGRSTLTIGGEKAVLIEVADTGVGIFESDLKSLFRPFYTTKSNGCGLGLFITRNIVREHKGKIDIKSRKGRTTFSILLPVDGKEVE
jgi:nitrogen-specific signal transduction histidine kinase